MLNTRNMRQWISVLGVLMSLVFFLSACQSSLPASAKTALDDLYRDTSSQNMDYKIISSEKVKLSGVDKNFIDEVWCVVTDKPYYSLQEQPFTHFQLEKNGLLWEAWPISNQDRFLQDGCKNW